MIATLFLVGMMVGVDPIAIDVSESIQAALAQVDTAKAEAAKARAYVPNAFQLAFHQSQARVRGAFTCNRAGKSFGAAHECNWWALGKHPYQQTPTPPVRIRCLGDGYEHGIDKVLVPIFRDLVNPADLQGGSWADGYSKGTHTIRYANGSTIEFMSYKLGDLGRGAQMFAGVDLDLLWADEHCPPEVWQENQARIGKRQLRSIVTLTPVLGKTWEYDDIWTRWQNGDPGYECFTSAIQDNTTLDRAAVDAFLASITDPKMRAVRERGEWINLGGQVYPMFDASRHVVSFDAARVRAATKSLIIDPHPSRNKGHHVLWCAVDSDQRMFCYREANYKTPIPEIADLIRSECTRDKSLNEDIRRYWIDPHWGWADNESGKSIAQQYQDAGIPVQPASADKTGGIQLVQTALEVSPSTRRAMLEVMASCPETARQFERYAWKPQTTAMREGDRWSTIDENDDYVTCLRYFVQTDPRYAGHDDRASDPAMTPTMRAIMERRRMV